MTRSTVTPRLANQAMARSRKATALSFRSSGRISVEARRAASSTQTCRNSQPMPLLLAAPVAGDAVADAADPAELLDVEVDQLAGPVALGSGRSRAWGRGGGAVRAGGGAGPGPRSRSGGRAGGRWRVRTGAGGGAPGSRPRGVRQPARAGMRPRRAVGEAGLAFRACRSRHLPTVVAVTPAAAASRATVQPSARRSIIGRRPWGVVLRILVDVHRVAPRQGRERGSHNLPAPPRMDNLHSNDS